MNHLFPCLKIPIAYHRLPEKISTNLAVKSTSGKGLDFIPAVEVDP